MYAMGFCDRLQNAIKWHSVGLEVPSYRQLYAYARQNDDTVAYCMLAAYTMRGSYNKRTLQRIMCEVVRTAGDANRPVRRFAWALADELVEAGIVTKIVT